MLTPLRAETRKPLPSELLKPIVKSKRIELGEGRSKQNTTTQSIVSSSSVCFLLKLVVRRGERRVGVTRIKIVCTRQNFYKEKKTHRQSKRKNFKQKRGIACHRDDFWGRNQLWESHKFWMPTSSHDFSWHSDLSALRELLVSTIFPRRSSQKTHQSREKFEIVAQ